MRKLLIAILIAAILSGCDQLFPSQNGRAKDDYGYGSPKELGALMERRDADEVLADRDRMITEITTEVTRIAGTRWRAAPEAPSTGCGEFYSTQGSLYFSPHYSAEPAIPDEKWDQVSQAVIAVAAKYGYTEVHQSAEYQTLTIKDAEGDRLGFLQEFFDMTTTCLLTTEEKRNARDAAPK